MHGLVAWLRSFSLLCRSNRDSKEKRRLKYPAEIKAKESKLELKFQPHRTVVRTHNIRINEGRFYSRIVALQHDIRFSIFLSSQLDFLYSFSH
ncbi:hypothetical protein MSHOH_1431 [Methanosarcina horonobensis HB-1 = JCM 15518]|uniref:Uncharacterized protein n=1 Tax=Methanosarcina horonobensis HB-1 = JCM 15518 TaxID=1434110 RepID=A0A0E3S8U7_9EURY|nr:hypothetical protein MSHOH_1431 [Methanosarcina horonobensis HB-1 = JCM 15518]